MDNAVHTFSPSTPALTFSCPLVVNWECLLLQLLSTATCRCRELYKKYLECFPSSCSAWSKFAEMENSLGEVERVRGLYEVAISRPLLDMPEVNTTHLRATKPRLAICAVHSLRQWIVGSAFASPYILFAEWFMTAWVGSMEGIHRLRDRRRPARSNTGALQSVADTHWAREGLA